MPTKPDKTGLYRDLASHGFFSRQSIRRASTPQVAQPGLKPVGYAFFEAGISSK
jgi:hypothetical protein